MSEGLDDKIVIELPRKQGMNPVVIWVPEWVQPYERRGEYIKAAKVEAERQNLAEIGIPKPSPDWIADLPNLFRGLASLAAVAGRYALTRMYDSMFHPEKKSFRDSFADYANFAASHVM